MREQVFWGWGERRGRPAAAGHAVTPSCATTRRCPAGRRGAGRARRRAPARAGAARGGAPGLARQAVGAGHVLDDAETRVLRCRGKSYLDLLAQRAGDCEGAPDAVVRPADHDQVAAGPARLRRAGVAVVPFGGGTSVVGGVGGPRDGLAGVSLDLGRMDRLESVDERLADRRARRPATRLPEAERARRARGCGSRTCPRASRWATVGGCVAPRSAGQSSMGPAACT